MCVSKLMVNCEIIRRIVLGVILSVRFLGGRGGGGGGGGVDSIYVAVSPSPLDIWQTWKQSTHSLSCDRFCDKISPKAE